MSLIEKDSFDFEFLSRIAERESWRKEIHRPVYHIHKWWAKRLGSIFRGILIGASVEEGELKDVFFEPHSIPLTVFDPFMGSGTTIGEAHKLGFAALGMDINPVATKAVKVALGPLDRTNLQKALVSILDDVGLQIQQLYKSKDSKGRECDVLYYFWVMRALCTVCQSPVDLFPSYVIASNAYPDRKPEVHVLCPNCGNIFRAANKHNVVACNSCRHEFLPDIGPARGAKATCNKCATSFAVVDAMSREKPPSFRLYGKLVLTRLGTKEYLASTKDDEDAYEESKRLLDAAVEGGWIKLPTLELEDGYNTRQALTYGFRRWRDFFNDRQLLALGLLRRSVDRLADPATRDAMMVLFSGVLEFNNLFTSYKGEGTGAVRHMFAHHVLKPERVPIEANLWGTPKSSGSFTGLFKGRLLRALEYRLAPKEIDDSTETHLSAQPFSGEVQLDWPPKTSYTPRRIYLGCGDSACSGLQQESIDFVVTDPPFFDNVHYSELADFFYAWHQEPGEQRSTRQASEVQDTDSKEFADKLRRVFEECRRILKRDGLLIFTYHHSRSEGWNSVARAIIGSGFVVVNSHPVKAEMSVATPKSQAKEPIQLDIILVCRKADSIRVPQPSSRTEAIANAQSKARRLEQAGFKLSRNDRKVILFGQLLATLRTEQEIAELDAVAAQQEVVQEQPLVTVHAI